MLIEKCLCGSEKFSAYILNGIDVRECIECNLIHQNLKNFTKKDIEEFYKHKYHDEFMEEKGIQKYSDRYTSDYKVSEIRLEEYKDFLTINTEKIFSALDIGSSNGAFVDCLRKKGIRAYGLEPGMEGNNKYTYNCSIEELGFDNGFFDLITMHDVLEHIIDPIDFLKKVNKKLNYLGTLIVDIPDFFSLEGKKHWKYIEHLWYWSQPQAIKMFDSLDLEVKKITRPIPGKLVFYLKKKRLKRKKILLMPGTGDIYWALIMLQDFIKKELNNEMPLVYTCDWTNKHQYVKGSHRSLEFIKHVPFIEFGGVHSFNGWPREFDLSYSHRTNRKTNNEVSKPILTNLLGYDYIINYNGILEEGGSIDNLNYTTNWDINLYSGIDEELYRKQYKKQYQEYNIGYFTGTGSYKEFIDKFSPSKIYKLLLEIYKQTGRKTVLIGVSWDKPIQQEILNCDTQGILIDEIEKTNQTQLIALIKESASIVGWASGTTIIAASMFNKPSVVYWNSNKWNPEFNINCINPKAVNYCPVDIIQASNNFEKHIVEVINVITPKEI